MSQKRQRKLQKDKEKERKAAERHNDQVMEALRVFGLLDGFIKLPQRLRTNFLAVTFSPPRVVISPSAEGRPEAKWVVEGFKRTRIIPMKPDAKNPYPATFVNTLMVLPSLGIFFNHNNNLCDKGILSRKFLRDFFAFELQYKAFIEIIDNGLLTSLYKVCLGTCLFGLSRPNGKILWFDESVSKAGQRPHFVFSLQCAVPESRRVSIDGNPRQVFRCYQIDTTSPPQPITWTGKELGFGNDNSAYPVYIQNHAIEQGIKRTNTLFAHFHLCSYTINNPTFHFLANGRFLLAYRIGPYVLGYFVCQRIGDMIVLLTFLFKGMQGTPEADQLQQKLGLQRPDIEYNKLDQLDTFSFSDLSKDPELGKLLAECGLGDLLEIPKVGLGRVCSEGAAEEIRKYLCLPPMTPQNEPGQGISLPHQFDRLPVE